ncbi:MAG TPA: hypothetical protein VLI72_02285 [Methylibium sp.]|nr:hypothetical protein [Methylibium sp.]
MDYETGVLIALLLWAFNAIMVIVNVNSQFERNIRKIGMRLSWLTLQPKPLSVEAKNRSWWKNVGKYLFLTLFGLPWTLLSWLYVAMAAGMFLWRWSKTSGTPQAIKEYRWKLRNQDLDFDTLLRETMKVSDKSPSEFDQFRADTIADLKARGLR